MPLFYCPIRFRDRFLFDCAAFDGGQPARLINRPEQAIIEVATALNVENPTIEFYDFRNPQASGIILHWLFLPGNGSQVSSITLPITNMYNERGYAFCTALSNSKLWLNGQIIDQQGAISQPIYRWGLLGSDQLRVGQVNNMKIEDITFFGYGFIGGVSAEYSGATIIPTSGGYRRDITLIYPSMLGEPLEISRIYFPIIGK